MPPTRLNSHQLRASRVGKSQKISQSIPRHPFVIVLDNVLDTYNIGSFFRLADAIAAEKIYLCGSIVTPPNIKIHRASIGTWKWVPWEHHPSTLDCLTSLHTSGYQIIACEQTTTSIDYRQAKYHSPCALVFGNESTGISSLSLNISDLCVNIPMYGINRSLNVLVAATLIGYHLANSFTDKLVNKPHK